MIGGFDSGVLACICDKLHLLLVLEPRRIMSETISDKALRVAIIGAGCAGLASGQALKRFGINPVIFEARNRVGGRILTISASPESRPSFQEISYHGTELLSPMYNVDAGGSSMHGCDDKDNLVLRRAVVEKVTVPSDSRTESYETTRGAVWYSSGKRIPQSVVLFMHDFYDVVKAKVAAYASKKQYPEKTMLRPIWNRYVEKVEKTLLSRKLSTTERQILFKIEQRWLGFNNSTRNCSCYEITAYNVEHVADLRRGKAKSEALAIEGDFVSNEKPKLSTARMPCKTRDQTVVDGYTPFLIETLKKGLDIRLKKQVKRVTGKRSIEAESSEAPIKIFIQTTDEEEEEFDFVIVTLPLGVLKSRDPRNMVTFTPPLSPRKQRSLSLLSMGRHNKVILRFQEKDVFWPHSMPHLNCLDERFQFLNLHAYGKRRRNV